MFFTRKYKEKPNSLVCYCSAQLYINYLQIRKQNQMKLKLQSMDVISFGGKFR